VNQKASEAVYIPLSDRFNPNDSYRKAFKRSADFFDLQSDLFLLTELLFKDIFNLREHLAQKIDCSPASIIEDIGIYSISLQFAKSR
jgi:hypothetical protein